MGEGLPAPTPKSHFLPLSLFSHPSLGWGWVLGGGDKLQVEEWRLDFEKHFPTVRPDQGHGIPEMDTPGQTVEVCKQTGVRLPWNIPDQGRGPALVQAEPCASFPQGADSGSFSTPSLPTYCVLVIPRKTLGIKR